MKELMKQMAVNEATLLTQSLKEPIVVFHGIVESTPQGGTLRIVHRELKNMFDIMRILQDLDEGKIINLGTSTVERQLLVYVITNIRGK